MTYNNKLPREANPKFFSDSMNKIIIVLLAVIISPFIVNCLFAFPQTDDFAYSSIARGMGFLKAQYFVYVTWSGRFTSTALLSVNPLVYDSFIGYRLVFAFLILVQITAIYLLTGALTNKIVSRQERLIFTFLLFIAFLDQMDDIRSGLYWMAGVVTYQVAETMALLYITLFLLINRDPKYGSLFNKSLVIVLAILLGGTNEIVMVLVLLITIIFVLNSYIVKKVINPFHTTTLIAAFTGNCLCIMAPGNANRLSTYLERENLYVTIWKAFNKSLLSIEVWITSPLTLILMCMVLFAVISKSQLRSLFSGYKIVSSSFLLLFLTFVCFFIPYWSTGMPPQNRVFNMIYFFFLCGWMINLAIVFARYAEAIAHFIKKIPIKSVGIIVVAFMIVLFSLGTSNFILVTEDLLTGNSFRYYAEMQQRKSQIINSDKDICTLEDITVTPRSLYFFFVGYDSNYWVNESYAAYFKKKSIALIKKSEFY